MEKKKMKKEDKKVVRPSRRKLLALVSALSEALDESNRMISECFDSAPSMAPEDWSDHRSVCERLIEEAREVRAEDA